MEKIIKFLNQEKTLSLLGGLSGLVGLSLIINGIIISYGLSLFPDILGNNILWGMIVIGVAVTVLGFSVVFSKKIEVKGLIIKVLFFAAVVYTLVLTISSVFLEIDSLKYNLINPIDTSEFYDIN